MVANYLLRGAGRNDIFAHRMLMEHFADLGIPQGALPRNLGTAGEQVEDLHEI